MILLKFSKSTIFEIQSKWAHQIASTRCGETFYDIKNQFFSNFKISLFSPKSKLFENRCFSCFFVSIMRQKDCLCFFFSISVYWNFVSVSFAQQLVQGDSSCQQRATKYYNIPKVCKNLQKT